MPSSSIMRVLRLAAVSMALVLTTASGQAQPLLFYGAMPGSLTLDEGEGGGNPFASALIEALSTPIALSDLPPLLRRLTAAKSKGFQAADVPVAVLEDYTLVPAKAGEARIALVLVISDYRSSGLVQSLPGAKRDAERIGMALLKAGFQVELAVDLDLSDMRHKLDAFRERSRLADVAALYTTGHGVEVDRTTYLIPGDYPIAERNSALSRRALSLPDIARSLAAKKVNLLFYAGCRNDPLGQ